MKKILFMLLIALCIVSCHNNYNPDEIDDDISYLNCEQVYDNGNYFANCEEMIDTVGLKLYHFVHFTDEEWRSLPNNIKLERRQIPEDFLRGMTTKELFYQIVYTDVSKNLNNFLPEKRLNMVNELLNRPDAGHVLLELLQMAVPSIEEGGNCFWWRLCLQIYVAAPEFINCMTDEEICTYIHHQLRWYEITLNLCKKDDECICGDTFLIFIGLGHVMIRYEYDPFTQTLKRDKNTNEFIWRPPTLEQALRCDFQVINYVEQFINKKP